MGRLFGLPLLHRWIRGYYISLGCFFISLLVDMFGEVGRLRGSVSHVQTSTPLYHPWCAIAEGIMALGS
jgi:hypothetical protein